MHISSVTVRVKRNCGNFESFDVEATMQLSDEDDAVVAAHNVQTYVDTVANTRMDQLRRPGARGGKDAGEPWPEL